MRSVDEYIEALPDDRREIAERIREIILQNVPGIQEKLSFKIPFYHYFGMFMYLNNTREGIDVAFCRGKDLLEVFPLLSIKARAIVATVCISKKKEIEKMQLSRLIIAAAAWNEESKRLRIPMVKKPAGKKKK